MSDALDALNAALDRRHDPCVELRVEIERLRKFARGVLGPEGLNFDVLDEQYGRLIANQWEANWKDIGEAHAAGFNEGLAERDALAAKVATLTDALRPFGATRKNGAEPPFWTMSPRRTEELWLAARKALAATQEKEDSECDSAAET